ncbi:hypothetical protein [Micromonospora sp. WMMC250]|uniref:hypothetical protein n=1 Tax=Micromonospora sp. WMMC250 TaxID=3014781 RepID=UPI0022B73562|nr:hypothetical protein [Micromonospora sp. WMMC250]MCZ7375287.1 hypothetical protein [Micromonospora sp. WMMC250]
MRPPLDMRKSAPAPAQQATYLMVGPSGRLTVLEAAADGGRRITTGAAFRVRLDEYTVMWLEDDQQGNGVPNWTATQMALETTGRPYLGPWDAPYLCGPVIFTGAGRHAEPIGLTDRQFSLLVDAHAATELW